MKMVLMSIGFLFLFMGCGGIDETQRARLIKTEPPGTRMHPFRPTIELVFNASVRNVRVDGLRALPNDSFTAFVWKGTLSHLDTFSKPGTHQEQFICLKVTYEDKFGERIEELCGWLPWTVLEYPSPRIISGTVKDGDKYVNSQQLNRDGITFSFDPDIPILPDKGRIEIRPINGESLNWNAVWTPLSVKIIPLTDNELSAGIYYMITIRFEDAKGDRLKEEISFRTKD